MKRILFPVFFFALALMLICVGTSLAQETGSVKLTVADSGAVSDTVRMGELNGATSGLDASLGEFELPPVPPSGAFDVRWIVSGVEGLSVDYRDTLNAQSTRDVWILQFQPSASGYPVTINWDSTKLWSGFFQMYDATTGGTKINVDMKAHGSVKITDNSIKSLTIVHTFTVNRSVSLHSGWNLVSVPIGAKNWGMGDIFPNSVTAFSYSGGYQAVSTMAFGAGYWVNCSSSGTANITGEPFPSDTIAVASGWNLIGSTFSAVSTTSIQQIPSSIVSSYYFSYSNGYKSTTTISSGQGIWVKTNQAGKLVLSSSSLSKTSQAAPAIDFTRWNTITITDAKGATGELLFSSAAANVLETDMPPAPPQGVFDVRFAGDRFAGVLPDSSAVLKMQLQGVEGPAKIQWKIIDGKTYFLSGVAPLQVALSGEGTMVADKLGISAELMAFSANGESSVPTKFQLYQNYPNPFNPTTTIRYDIPKAGQVTLKVCDILGREITTLIDAYKAPGSYPVTFDASHLSSGVYFYRIDVTGSDGQRFTSIKRFVLLK